MPSLGGPLIGPTLGGFMVEYLSWHWIFFINLPVGIIGLIATARYMPSLDKTDSQVPFDLWGFLMFGSFMLSITIGLEGMGEFHFPVSITVTLLIAGAISIIVYFLYARKTATPIFAISLFQVRNFRIGILGNICARLGNGAMPFLTPLLLQMGMGYSALQAGIAMIPMTAGAIVAKWVVIKLLHRFGFKPVLVINTMMLGIMIAVYSLITPEMNYWVMLGIFTVFGLINSTQFTAMNTVTLVDLSQQQASSGNSMFAAVQQLSMGMGVAVAASILDYFMASSGYHTGGNTALSALSSTYICLGTIAFISTILFVQLGKSSVK